MWLCRVKVMLFGFLLAARLIPAASGFALTRRRNSISHSMAYMSHCKGAQADLRCNRFTGQPRGVCQVRLLGRGMATLASA